jgi:hypothetical protein
MDHPILYERVLSLFLSTGEGVVRGAAAQKKDTISNSRFHHDI